ncbi:hypothetical protein BLNAU_14057 [Blattamonas nauphoetae]|uniref:Uncharacterized protein n=1 Tax=Blattamonas nauphoetae TaxID=2049346 RepID=A0ABQ9XJI2_9EUKA|nr:hypothetical protein BLNAU_14057 [Blattamonas nauphoetae]
MLATSYTPSPLISQGEHQESFRLFPSIQKPLEARALLNYYRAHPAQFCLERDIRYRHAIIKQFYPKQISLRRPYIDRIRQRNSRVVYPYHSRKYSLLKAQPPLAPLPDTPLQFASKSIAYARYQYSLFHDSWLLFPIFEELPNEMMTHISLHSPVFEPTTFQIDIEVSFDHSTLIRTSSVTNIHTHPDIAIFRHFISPLTVFEVSGTPPLIPIPLHTLTFNYPKESILTRRQRPQPVPHVSPAKLHCFITQKKLSHTPEDRSLKTPLAVQGTSPPRIRSKSCLHFATNSVWTRDGTDVVHITTLFSQPTLSLLDAIEDEHLKMQKDRLDALRKQTDLLQTRMESQPLPLTSLSPSLFDALEEEIEKSSFSQPFPRLSLSKPAHPLPPQLPSSAPQPTFLLSGQDSHQLLHAALSEERTDRFIFETRPHAPPRRRISHPSRRVPCVRQTQYSSTSLSPRQSVEGVSPVSPHSLSLSLSSLPFSTSTPLRSAVFRTQDGHAEWNECLTDTLRSAHTPLFTQDTILNHTELLTHTSHLSFVFRETFNEAEGDSWVRGGWSGKGGLPEAKERLRWLVEIGRRKDEARDAKEAETLVLSILKLAMSVDLQSLFSDELFARVVKGSAFREVLSASQFLPTTQTPTLDGSGVHHSTSPKTPSVSLTLKQHTPTLAHLCHSAPPSASSLLSHSSHPPPPAPPVLGCWECAKTQLGSLPLRASQATSTHFAALFHKYVFPVRLFMLPAADVIHAMGVKGSAGRKLGSPTTLARSSGTSYGLYMLTLSKPPFRQSVCTLSHISRTRRSAVLSFTADSIALIPNDTPCVILFSKGEERRGRNLLLSGEQPLFHSLIVFHSMRARSTFLGFLGKIPTRSL